MVSLSEENLVSRDTLVVFDMLPVQLLAIATVMLTSSVQ